LKKNAGSNDTLISHNGNVEATEFRIIFINIK
jgi:hypothetical protein